MSDALRVIVEINQQAWVAFKSTVANVDSEEINWRPLPQSNSINTIVRHLRIEAQWHVDSLLRGEKMPGEITAALQEQIDSVPLDFQRNLAKLEELVGAFLTALSTATTARLQERTEAVYADSGDLQYLLAYHQALHLTAHCGQIRMIRNLYSKARGQQPRFFPVNPTFPTSA